MRRTLFPLFMVVAVVLLIAALVGIARAQGGTRAAAQLVDAEGNPVGTAEFIQEPNGVTISVNLQQGQQVVTPGEHGTNHMTTGGAIGQFIGQPAVTPGEHGIHIHETGDITPDFEAAGGHFNPTNAQHGFNNPQGPHAGDLENIIVNEDGSTSYRTTNALVTLSRGHNN